MANGKKMKTRQGFSQHKQTRQNSNTNHALVRPQQKYFSSTWFSVVILKKGNFVKFDGIHLPNQEITKEVDENGYTSIGILELDEIKEHEMKIKLAAEYERRLRLILKSKLNGKSKIQAINIYAVALLRYGAIIINWKVDELKKMERTTRKTYIGLYEALHQRVTLIDYIWN